MAKLPQETTSIVLDLQARLLDTIDTAKAAEFTILEQFGQAEATIEALEQLQNITERLRNPYSRFCTLLLRIAEAQPVADADTLELLNRTMEQAQATIAGAQVSIRESKADLNLS
ncbi:hypothetical protein QUB63_32705 [Microcoleus sp. ARI1-B5]|uniref:hypothetical protein n=1 Tax=unclassified Microcoleus TaxID=2642155 RepID=UPI002FD48C30